MKVLLLDNDGVICLSSNWGSRHKKQKKWGGRKLSMPNREMPVEYRFDNFDENAIKVLNEILEQTDVEIVVSSDWRMYATLSELGEYYISQGIIKAPIGVTKKLGEFDVPEDFEWSRQWDSEQIRCFEIHQYLKDNPQITHWVAVDDLNMGKTGLHYSMEFEHSWGLENFVWTPLPNEGIKQSGIKEKILEYLIDEK
jgi:hypothetical protein